MARARRGPPTRHLRRARWQVALICGHDLKFPAEVFDGVSTGAKGFIRLLLDPDHKMRLRVDEVRARRANGREAV
jgi:hypothetical protein